ncbi:MAG: TetR family transcriptional regulator, partial [Mycobacteriaceae bacterium]|nr:TetR family transcriptional regulator [Mycobacteriaceae bacterium]
MVVGERSGAGDPAHTLELLWRAPGTGGSGRGPKQRTTVDAVVDAAIGIADREGLSAVTMRSVAARLGLSPMGTYTYVPGKAELLDLMLDTVYARMARTELAGKPWRERLAAVAADNRALLIAHAWVLDVSTTRPPLGPGLMAKYEHELAAFDDTGIDDVAMDATLTHLLGFVAAVARIDRDTAAAAADTASSDQQWWERHAPLLAKALDPARYPRATRVGAAAGAAHAAAYDADHAWTFGLPRILDGLASLF